MFADDADYDHIRCCVLIVLTDQLGGVCLGAPSGVIAILGLWSTLEATLVVYVCTMDLAFLLKASRNTAMATSDM